MLRSLATPLACLLALACATGLAGPLLAQEITATLEVRVTGPSGQPVAGARIHVESPSRGMSGAVAVTDEDGRALLLSIPPAGDHVLTVGKKGYLAYQAGGIALEAGRRTVLEIELAPEGAPQRVEVRPERRPVDTSETRSATSWSAETLEDLPVLGRQYTDILTYAPGVTDTDRDGNPNVQGSRETALQYRLDGGDISDPASGSFGKNLDFEIIQEMEMLTAGASVAYGRAQGGFANLITKSGGNDHEGSLRLAWRNTFLDGQSATGGGEEAELNGFRATAALGGPILRDRVWYFVSAGRIDTTSDLRSPQGNVSITTEGWNTFAKVSWQPRPDQRLSFQVSVDPRRFEGLFDSVDTSPEAASDWSQGGTSWQARWAYVARPGLILETSLSGFDSGISTDPTSSRFRPLDIQIRPSRFFSAFNEQAIYPTAACSTDGTAQGFIPNCDPALGPVSISHTDLFTGRVSGPAAFELEDDRERTSFRQEVTASQPAPLGEHLLHGGVELSLEELRDSSFYNPVLLDATQPCPTCRGPTGQPIPNAVTGFQTLLVPEPGDVDLASEGTYAAAFLSDSWKPLPNLSINAGLRLDVEEIESEGMTSFDPAGQRRRSVRIVSDLCAEGLRLATGGSPGMNNAQAICSPSVFRPFYGTAAPLIFEVDPNTPRWIRELAGMDMLYHSSQDLVKGRIAWQAPLTVPDERGSDPVRIRNENLSPRLGLAWDPWSDGRTRVFGSWGRYYDRVFLGVAAHEARPVFKEFTFTPSPFIFRILPDQLSEVAENPTIQMLDRDLRTPRSDVLTLGVERELTPGWSATLTWTQRLAFNLHQDRDANHATCLGLRDEVGVEPETICIRSIDPNGTVTLGDDLFGAPFGGPNGLTDLFALNPYFNRVLLVESSESARYRAWTLELRRRRLGSWDLRASYTWSKAQGGGLGFTSVIGNDPAPAGRETAWLDLDQRHRIVLYGTATLPRRVDVGASIRWESGIPYSVVSSRTDEDDVGSTTTRRIYAAGQRNNRRGPDHLVVDARLAKHFLLGPVAVSAELAVENLLDEDEILRDGFAESGSSPIRLPGRMWEAGMVFRF